MGSEMCIRDRRNILQLADATGTQSFDDADWVDGWQTPLHKALHRAINRRSPTTAASLTQIIHGFCSAMESDCTHGSRGPEVLRGLERRLSGFFDTSTQASAIQRLSSFGVATDVPFSDYLRQFKLVVSSTTGVGRQTGPSDAMCQSYVRNSVAEQFPTLMPSLFPGTLAYRDVPYPVSYTHLRAHETSLHLVCRLLLEKKKL